MYSIGLKRGHNRTIDIQRSNSAGFRSLRCLSTYFWRTCSRLRYLMFVFTIMSLTACVSQKALIDQTAMEKIYWPGPPEKPRISYLWNITAGSDDAGSRAFHMIAGSDDMTDPRSSSRLLRPYGLFVDELGLLYITDPGAARITIVNPKDGDIRHLVSAGNDELVSPIGIAAFQERIFVSDSFLKKVFILERGGKLVGTFEGLFERPTAIALDKVRKHIYVADTQADTIYRYTPEGQRLGSIGKSGTGEGEFHSPTHIWVDQRGDLYVTDTLNFRVQRFSAGGVFQNMFGMLGDAHGDLDKPKGIATDSDGNVYVVDSIKDTIKIFSPGGDLLLFFGRQGTNYGEFWLPSGIFMDSQDRLFVADTYNSRIQVFRYLRNR